MTNPLNPQAAYALNGQPCSREQFYAVACDPRRPVVVQACAGAGKTWMLVSRMLRALLAGAQPHEILAITFTKKAAGEMRERLQQWLHEFSQMEQGQLRQELIHRGVDEKTLQSDGLLGRNLISLLSNLYHQTLHAERPVQIRTFHSWFASLVGCAPLAVLQALGLPPTYELLEDDAQAIELLWPQFYALLQRDEGLHRIYREAVADVGRWGVQEALSNALAKRVEFALADQAGVVAHSIEPVGKVWPEFAALDAPLEMLAQQRALLMKAAGILAKVKQASYAKCGVSLEMALSQQAWSEVPICLLTQKDEPRKFSKELQADECIQAAQQLCQQVQQAQQQHAAWLHQQRMAQLSRALIECFAQLKRQRGWVDMGDLERAALHLLSDTQLSGWVQQRLDAQVKHLLIDEFQDTNPLQWQALQSWLSGYVGAGGDRPSVFIVGDAKQSIYRFRRAEPQVFESATQFVCQGLEGTLLSCDHTRRNAPAVVELVNAVMQQAQQQQAYEYRAHTTESQAAGQVLVLPLTPQPAQPDRQDKEVDWVWRDSLSQPRYQPQELAVDTECQLAARWVSAQIAKGIPSEEIMVLARKRDRLSRMRDALRQQGVASQIAEKMALVELPEVQDVVALLDALISPGNDLALARALKSPLLGWSDAQLMALASAVRRIRQEQEQEREQRTSWFDALQILEHSEHISSQPVADFDVKDRQWAAQTARRLRSLQALFRQLTVHDALSRVYQELQVIERLMAAAPAPLRARVQASLQALLYAALQASGGRFLTPHAWIRQLKAGTIAAPSAAHTPGAVRLMTIHGAKGLEAHTVLMLDTNTPAEKAKSLDVLVDWPGHRAAPQTFAFLRSENNAPSCVQAALTHERSQRAREEVNALYVAMTRAKNQLVFSAHEVRSSDERCPWQRLQAVGLEQPRRVQEAWHGDFALPAPSSSATHAALEMADQTFSIFELPKWASQSVQEPVWGSNQGIAERNTARDAIDSVARTAAHAQHELGKSKREDAADVNAAKLGSCLHRILELYRPGQELRSLAAQVGAGFSLDMAQTEQAAQMAQAILEGEAAWAWDERRIDWQANEVELIYQGQLLRIDRLVRTQSDAATSAQWWVLDYKSSLQPQRQEALRAQLLGYAQAVKAAMPEGEAVLDVKAAFIAGDGRLVPLL